MVLSVIGLVFLLLISPCKVRNFLQAQLEIPTTSVLNKSQTTISATSCVDFDVAQVEKASSTSKIKANDAFHFDDFSTYQFTVLIGVQKAIIRKGYLKLVTATPLYILYQKIQVYS